MMNHIISSATTTGSNDTTINNNDDTYTDNKLVLPNTVRVVATQQHPDEQSTTIVPPLLLQQQQQQQQQHSDILLLVNSVSSTVDDGNSSTKEIASTIVPGIDLSSSTLLQVQQQQQQQQQEYFVKNSSTTGSTATVVSPSNLLTNPIAMTTTTSTTTTTTTMTTISDEQQSLQAQPQRHKSNILQVPIHFDNKDSIRDNLSLLTSSSRSCVQHKNTNNNSCINETKIKPNISSSTVSTVNDIDRFVSSNGNNNNNNSNSTTKAVSFDRISKNDNSNRSSSSSNCSNCNTNSRRNTFVTNLSNTATCTKQHITQTPNNVITVLKKQQSIEKSFRFFTDNPWFPTLYEYETIVVQKQQQQDDDDDNNNSDDNNDNYDNRENTSNNITNNNRQYLQQETYKHKRSIRRRIFLTMTEPQSSIIGMIFFIMLMIGIQIMNAVLILQSMRAHQYTPASCNFCDQFENSNNTSILTKIPIDIECQCEPVPHEWTTVALHVIVNVLGIEIFLRIILFTPPIQQSMKQASYYQKVYYFIVQLKRFIFSARFIIDALAIFPYFSNSVDHVKGFVPLRFLQLFVVFQIVQLGRYNKAFQSFVVVLQKAFSHLKILLVILSFGALIFGSLIYWTERGTWQYYEYTNSFEYVRNSTNGDLGLSPFTSIPQSFWWFIVTATTVGYGDMYPVTGFGQFIASMAMIMGLLVIAYPVSVFSELWSIEMRRQGVIKESDDNDTTNDNEIDNHNKSIDFNFNDNNESDVSTNKHKPTTVEQSDKYSCTVTKPVEQDTADGKEVLQQIKEEEEEEIVLVNDIQRQQQQPPQYNINATSTADLSLSESIPSLSSPNCTKDKETTTNRRVDNTLILRNQSSSTPVMRLVRSNSRNRSTGSTDSVGGSAGTGSSRRLLRWIDYNKSSKQINTTPPTDEEYGNSIVEEQQQQQQPTRTTTDFTLLQLDKKYIAFEKEDLTTLLIEMQMMTESQRRIQSILKKYKLS